MFCGLLKLDGEDRSLGSVGKFHGDGRQIVPASWIEAALTIRRPSSRPGQSYGYFIFEENYRTACGEQSVWYMAGNGGSQILVLRELNAAIVVTRTAYNVRGTSAQSADMLKKFCRRFLAPGSNAVERNHYAIASHFSGAASKRALCGGMQK